MKNLKRTLLVSIATLGFSVSPLMIEAQATQYSVVAGDTLWKVAKANGVTVAELKQWNNLTSDFLQIGQKLTVSAPETPETPETPTEPSTVYTVVAGDSLWKIANANGVTVVQIKQWNNLTSDFLQIGQKLKLTGTTAPEAPEAPETPEEPSEPSTVYTVVAGDSLWKIANAHGVTVAQIKQWNNLSSDFLQIGQKLKLTGTTAPETPEKPTEPSTVYTVVAGDSLWKIANAHGVTVAQIKQWNNLSSDFLQIGQKLKLTGTTAPETPEEPSEPSTVYTVVAGDSLWKIANAHGVTVAQIKQWNNLTSDFLQIGQKLKLTGTTAPETPEEPSEPSTVYTVVAGDSLWKIANAHGVTVAQIKQWNKLTSDFLQIGQKLKLAGTTAPEEPSKQYTVVKGDSLWKIANVHGVTVAQIKQWNNLTSDFLQIGQKLKLAGTTAPEEPSKQYTVVKGDSLWTIAQAHGTTVAKIKQLNNLTSDFLQIGQKLTIK